MPFCSFLPFLLEKNNNKIIPIPRPDPESKDNGFCGMWKDKTDMENVNDYEGNQKAIKLIHNLDFFSISVITYMEIVQGVRNKEELNTFKKALGILNAKVIQIDELVSTKAMFFVEQYTLSHSMKLADALIGATSIIKNIPLLTGNDKHYKYLPEISIQKFII